MRRIGQRLNCIPRERLYFALPLVSYPDYHQCFRQFKRTELNGKTVQQLARRGDDNDGLDVMRGIWPVPRTETRELWLWDGSQPGAPGEFDDDSARGDIADFLSLQCLHIKSVNGFGHIKLLKRGDLAFVYHVKAKFFSNPDLHSRRVKIWFSFGVHFTTGRTRRNPHTSLSQPQRKYMDRTARKYPTELLALGYKLHTDFTVDPHLRRERPEETSAGALITDPPEPLSERDTHASRRAYHEEQITVFEREDDRLRLLQEEAEAGDDSSDSSDED